MTTPATTPLPIPGLAPTATELTSSSESVRGRFLWYELMTPDPDLAGGFYSAVLGWHTAVWSYDATTAPYTLFLLGDVPVAGMMRLPERARARGAGGQWIAYLGAPDLDEMHAEALRLGARSYAAPVEVPTVGRTAVVADPQGATVAFHTPATPTPAALDVGAGEFAWHELATADAEQALAFYTALTGWARLGEAEVPVSGRYRLFGQGTRQLGGVYELPAGSPVAPHWLLYVRVNVLDATIERVRDHGGEVVVDPMEVPGGHRIAVCRDPQGGAFGLLQRRATAVEG
jgi:predicted enzyme related to lactoylglutathione lyase